MGRRDAGSGRRKKGMGKAKRRRSDVPTTEAAPAGEGPAPGPSDVDVRTAFFDHAGDHAPYVGVETEGCRFVISTSDYGVERSLFVKQGRPEFRVLRRAVSVIEILAGDDAVAGRQFVDVGAHVGTSTVYALVSQRFGSAIACEPEPDNYLLLQANLALNALAHRVRTLRVAVSNRAGTSELVVKGNRKGQSWIAVDRQKIADWQAARATQIAEHPDFLADPDAAALAQFVEVTTVEVELVTLDHLARTGVIDPEGVGMVWIDAEGHEGHVLEGAGALVDRGLPVVLEFCPDALDDRGDLGMVETAAQTCYTHFVDVRRQQAGEPRFQLRAVAELPPYAERFRGPDSPGRFTDLLLLRLDAEQARAGASLPELVAKRRT